MTINSTQAPLLEARAITKRFPGVVALKGVSLTLNKGEVLAVIGENGAGKSTLMKILAGIVQPDSGELLIDGIPVVIPSPRAAGDLGIALIHQELNLLDNLDVGANIFMGREPNRMGFIDRTKIRADSEKLLKRVGLNIAPDTLLSTLSIGHQQMVEIAAALSVNARVIIMDEPTSSLSSHEAQALSNVIKELRASGAGIVYISHRLGEVTELADRVTVLRDGSNAGGLVRQEISHDSMVRLMVGRDLSQFYGRKTHSPGAPVLEVRDLVTAAWPRQKLNFTVRAGEIVGMAGLVGAGRSEVLRVIFGIDPKRDGEVLVGDKPLESNSPIGAIEAGVALVPEDRKQQGLILEMAVRHNISLAGLRRKTRMAGLLDGALEAKECAEMIGKLNIKTPSGEQIVQFLSGGNQQKVALAKWLLLNPRVLLLDEPTRGIDVGAKEEIYRLMEELAGHGMAILFASSEMEEVLGMSDRTLVMHEGRISGLLERSELNEEAVMHLATGRTRITTRAVVVNT